MRDISKGETPGKRLGLADAPEVDTNGGQK
jgi:hypothetical protein